MEPSKIELRNVGSQVQVHHKSINYGGKDITYHFDNDKLIINIPKPPSGKGSTPLTIHITDPKLKSELQENTKLEDYIKNAIDILTVCKISYPKSEIQIKNRQFAIKEEKKAVDIVQEALKLKSADQLAETYTSFTDPAILQKIALANTPGALNAIQELMDIATQPEGLERLSTFSAYTALQDIAILSKDQTIKENAINALKTAAKFYSLTTPKLHNNPAIKILTDLAAKEETKEKALSALIDVLADIAITSNDDDIKEDVAERLYKIIKQTTKNETLEHQTFYKLFNVLENIINNSKENVTKSIAISMLVGLGKLYFEGKDEFNRPYPFTRDINRAFICFTMAANQGHLIAKDYLQRMGR